MLASPLLEMKRKPRQKMYAEKGTRINLAGQVYGRLTVIGPAPTDMRGKGVTRWYARCECGTIRIFTTRSLRVGDAMSCGHGCIARLGVLGKVFGRLTVITEAPYQNLKAHFRCRCECGAEVIVDACNLRSGHTQSCGCLPKDMCSFLGKASRTHGQSLLKGPGRKATPTYATWNSMLDRCCNPKSDAFPQYGGRGIAVCEEWLSFEAFFRDMGERPHGLSLDRINNNLGYWKSNCRWATPKQQMLNRRLTLGIRDLDGNALSLADMADRLAIAPKTLRQKLLSLGVKNAFI